MPSAPVSLGECLRDLGRRGLGHHHDEVDVRVGVEPAQGLAGGEPADGRRQVATADAERVAHADPLGRLAGVVEEGEELLAAGAGGGDDADASGTDRVGEAEPDAVDRPRCRSPVP